MQTQQIKVQKTAHLYLIGQPSADVKRFIIACHGYGMAGKKFIKKFADLDDGKTLVVAPEALSRFYFVDPRDKDANPFFGNRVGASWLTKEDREIEIADHNNYLEQVYELLVPQLSADVRITLLGFSQGGPAVTRFALLKQPLFHNLVLWAAEFAHDLDYAAHLDFLKDKNIAWVFCKEDEFLTEKRLKFQVKFADNQKISYNLIESEGKHRVNQKLLNKLSQNWF